MAAGGRFSADAALLAALAAGKTIAEAAAAGGVSERTVFRRQTDAAFRCRVTEARAAMVERALARLADGMADAAGKLRELLAAERESVRLGAARALLELGVKLRDSVELEARLQALEGRLAEAGKPA